MTTPTGRGWWRRNRWWLPVVPLALAAMLAASSIRLGTFWWEADYHRATQEVAAGEWADVRDGGTDALGDFERHFRVRLDALTEVERFAPPESSAVQELPPGTRAVAAHLEFEADPEEPLAGCTVVLVGSDGVLYGGDTSDAYDQSSQCVPADRPGPLLALLGTETERTTAPGEERPEQWTTAPVMVVPDDARIIAVQIRYEPPDYLVLRAQD
ncbi:hypothetical protein SAMN04489844_3059 [Nocardioides exalbidus]|uniref:Uncharacterized protein n=1 Tax=Nocardioides exalbidus TaxID=402596 RepID=A0A1H4VMD5_9ACTN|nr:hypothetical protein [Nocardioides exalbidus]SEC82249.1 hypothetical protein SAMN04489844_3059 [Nocardioides exalbidus]